MPNQVAPTPAKAQMRVATDWFTDFRAYVMSKLQSDLGLEIWGIHAYQKLLPLSHGLKELRF